MQDVTQQLEPVDEPRARAREVRRRVDGHHPPRAELGELVLEVVGLVERALGVVALDVALELGVA